MALAKHGIPRTRRSALCFVAREYAMGDAERAKTGDGTIALMVMTPFIRLVLSTGPEVIERSLQELTELLGRWGLSISQLQADQKLRLPVQLMNELCEMCSEVLGDPAAPLRAAQQLQSGDNELLEYLVCTCPTMRDAILCLGQHYRLLADAEYELREEDGRAEVIFRFGPGVDASPQLYEFALASNFVMAMHHLQWDGVSLPIENRYRHPAPAHAEIFPSVMASPVRFDCDEYATVFPASLLDQPMKEANAVLHDVLLRQAERELAALPTQHALPHVVREVLQRDLTGDTSLEAVARTLGMSPSNLRARLRDHGTTFSEVLDSLRRDEARKLLADRAMSISEVAHALGFSHPPALHRAAQRWFGCAPSAFRESLHRAPLTALLERSLKTNSRDGH